MSSDQSRPEDISTAIVNSRRALMHRLETRGICCHYNCENVDKEMLRYRSLFFGIYRFLVVRKKQENV